MKINKKQCVLEEIESILNDCIDEGEFDWDYLENSDLSIVYELIDQFDTMDGECDTAEKLMIFSAILMVMRLTENGRYTQFSPEHIIGLKGLYLSFSGSYCNVIKKNPHVIKACRGIAKCWDVFNSYPFLKNIEDPEFVLNQIDKLQKISQGVI